MKISSLSGTNKRTWLSLVVMLLACVAIAVLLYNLKASLEKYSSNISNNTGTVQAVVEVE